MLFRGGGAPAGTAEKMLSHAIGGSGLFQIAGPRFAVSTSRGQPPEAYLFTVASHVLY